MDVRQRERCRDGPVQDKREEEERKGGKGERM